MRIRKPILYVGVGVLLLALLVGCGRPYFRGDGFSRGGKDRTDFALAMFDREVGKLGLTDAQKEQYEGVRSKVRTTAEAAREERVEIFEKIRNEFEKENPDIEATAAFMKEATQRGSDLMGEWLDSFVEIYNILDEEQKAKFTGMIKEHLNKGHRF